MNCRDAERLIFAERDGALDETQRAALATHLAGCPHCGRVRALLAEAADSWRAAGARVAAPDTGAEWRALRHRMRSVPGGSPVSPRRWPAPAWLGIPLGAAAALALLFTAGPTWFGGRGETGPGQAIARAEYVELAGDEVSAVVYVDEESGWLVVWAVERQPERRI